MTHTLLPSFVRIARMSEAFPGELAALQPALKGLIPDETNFTEDSYDELFAVLTAALYYARDAELRHASANATGGNPKLVKLLTDEGSRDKDALLAERILDRIAPYVPPRTFLHTLQAMYANREAPFAEYHVAIARIIADLYRIVTGFEPGQHCPAALVRWASGPAGDAIYKELLG